MRFSVIQIQLKNYYKVTFTRHPVDRLVSAYRNKFGEIETFQKRYGVNIVEKFRPKSEPRTGLGNDVTFSEFIEYLTDMKDLPRTKWDEHWSPMINLCQPCKVHYDGIGEYQVIKNRDHFFNTKFFNTKFFNTNFFNMNFLTHFVMCAVPTTRSLRFAIFSDIFENCQLKTLLNSQILQIVVFQNIIVAICGRHSKNFVLKMHKKCVKKFVLKKPQTKIVLKIISHKVILTKQISKKIKFRN